LGCEVADVDDETFFPKVAHLRSRLAARLLSPWLRKEYNEAILRAAAAFAPDFMLAFKGAHVAPDTLRALRARDLRVYNYYPDTSFFVHAAFDPSTLTEYDALFLTKTFALEDLRRHGVPIRRSVCIPHGYDPEVHKPWELTETDLRNFGCDVGFVATWTRHKEEVLAQFVAARPNVRLRIWGSGWSERCRERSLRDRVQGFPILGSAYAKALKSAAISLAVMSGRTDPASHGDETTTRTYEIPACGGFMLHERTPELLGLFREGEEVACFSSPQELAEKVDYYLAHPEERLSIAEAGRARCVPAYSYDNRMADLLRWHEKNSGAR
jgi:spore maturation protein CgeB